MNIKNFLGEILNRNKISSQDGEAAEAVDEIGKGAKTKIVAALLVAGFATYVAWWVQEPTTIRADVLASSATEETSDAINPSAINPASTNPIATNPTEQFVALNAATEQSSETQTNETQVSIIDFSFNPAEITVAKGTTVIWTNQDAIPHSVTGDAFSSGTLNSGETFTHTFDQDGTFAYHCSFHPQMKGTIIVGSGVGAGQIQSQEFAIGTQEPMLMGTEELSPSAPENAESLIPRETALSSIVANAASSQEQLAQEHAAALEQKKLAKSGPEDAIYAFIFLGILFLNRKKLLLRRR
jgi:plastocyanin